MVDQSYYKKADEIIEHYEPYLIMNKSTRKNLIFQKAKAFLIANM